MHRNLSLQVVSRGCRGRHRMVIGFITTYVISAYHHYTIATKGVSLNPAWLGVLDTTLCDKVYQ